MEKAGKEYVLNFGLVNFYLLWWWESQPTDSSPRTDSLTEPDLGWDSFPPPLSPPSTGPHCWLAGQL